MAEGVESGLILCGITLNGSSRDWGSGQTLCEMTVSLSSFCCLVMYKSSPTGPHMLYTICSLKESYASKSVFFSQDVLAIDSLHCEATHTMSTSTKALPHSFLLAQSLISLLLSWPSFGWGDCLQQLLSMCCLDLILLCLKRAGLTRYV